jgi:carbonic anhydrase
VGRLPQVSRARKSNRERDDDTPKNARGIDRGGSTPPTPRLPGGGGSVTGGAFKGRAFAAAGTGPTPAANTPAQALELLKQGNARFIEGNGYRGSLTARRLELTSGQSPFAVVLGCSDSRAPAETIFDQIPGHLFIVRVAGNFATIDGLGSIEYAIAVLHTPLVVVLGHSSCGAVDATVNYVRDGITQPGYIMDLVRAIEPAVKSAKDEAGDWLYNSIVQNVCDTVAALSARSAIVAEAVSTKSVAIVGSVYDLRSGKVGFLKPSPLSDSDPLLLPDP